MLGACWSAWWSATRLVGRSARLKLREEVEKGSLLIFAVVLGVAALGVARLLHADAILAVFVTGLAYNGVIGDESRDSEQELDDALPRYLVLPLFFLPGVEVPRRRG